MREIHQFLTSYSYGDAIGNEVLEIRNYLRKKGIIELWQKIVLKVGLN